MKKSTFPFLVLLGLLASLVTACDDDDSTPATPLTATTYTNLPADPITSTGGQPAAASGKYTFFSFKTGEIVPNADSASNKWDIGFRATRLIFNSGSSGPGMAGVSLQTGLFTDFRTVADTITFRTDNGVSLALPTASGGRWYNYNQTTNIITSIPGRVLIVRTGDGKYAKMEILSYYKDAPATPDPTSTSRYYTFRYSYQPDGSKKLE